MKTIYLSGPMSNYELLNHPAFDRNATFLRDLGYEVISPAEMDRKLGIDLTGNMNEEQYLNVIKHDYAALLTCDAIAFMPGWEKSRGAKLESDFANVLKLDRYRVDADKSYFEKEMIIGFTGFATAGKNALSEEFVTNSGFEQAGFADALKKILYSLDPIISQHNDGETICFDRVQDYVDEYGYEESKKIPEIRQLLQRLGTEGGRVALGEDVWVNTLFTQPHDARLVISDLRFENEAMAVKARGGCVIKVERPGIGPINNHASEQIDFNVDFTVQNDRTPKDAYLDVVKFLESKGWIL